MYINDQKITKEFCKGKDLVFFPQTLEEAQFIQRKIFEMGFKWGKGEYDFENRSVTIEFSSARLLEGLHLDKKGNLFAKPSNDGLISGLLCTSAQFDEKYLSPHEQLLAEFNKLSAKVDAIYEELRPTKLDKPVLKKPENESP